MIASKSGRGEASLSVESAKLGEDTLRAAKAHLDSSFDLFMTVVQARVDWRPSLSKAKWTLGKASKRIFGLAIDDGDEEERRTSELISRKRRVTDEEVLSNASSTGTATSSCSLMASKRIKLDVASPLQPVEFFGLPDSPRSGAESEPPKCIWNKALSKSRQLRARKLVKRARIFKTYRLQNRPAESRHTPSSISVGSRTVDLSKETVDGIYESACSIPNFATKLFSHLFAQSELLSCRNVYGRAVKTVKTTALGKDYLDPERVNLIRRLVQERAGPSEKIWSKCYQNMNKKLNKLKKALCEKRSRSKPKSFTITKAPSQYTKASGHLKLSSLYEKYRLCYEAMDQIYTQSISMPNFARNVMMHLFDEPELKECLNVNGLARNPTWKTGKCLDQTRINIIRQMVQENSAQFSKRLWADCVSTMNNTIKRLKEQQES